MKDCTRVYRSFTAGEAVCPVARRFCARVCYYSVTLFQATLNYRLGKFECEKRLAGDRTIQGEPYAGFTVNCSPCVQLRP